MAQTKSRRSKRQRNEKRAEAGPPRVSASASTVASASPPEAGANRSLSIQWQDWIAENLARGCVEADMASVMVDNGFEPGYASNAISVLKDMVRRVKGANLDASGISTYRCEPIRLPSVGSVKTQGNSVGIGFVMADPNVALLEDLLSPADCEELIEQSRGKLKRSEVVNRATGGFEVDAVRTSEGTHFERGESETIRRIEQRIADVTGVPVENGEPLQILHYEVGGEYLPHHDYFEPDDPGSALHLATGGQRIATIVIYLNTVPGGGETAFPNLDLSVRARAGNAVYFEYSNSDDELDERCLHAGVPVEKGEKWIATKWLRQSPYTRS